jgi:tetratricopeptide (TPR) repeat protein
MVALVAVVAMGLTGFSTIFTVDRPVTGSGRGPDRTGEGQGTVSGAADSIALAGSRSPSLTVLFSAGDRAWARWITRQLSECGYRAKSVAWIERENGKNQPTKANGPSSSEPGSSRLDADGVILLISRGSAASWRDGHWDYLNGLTAPGSQSSERVSEPAVVPILVGPCALGADATHSMSADLIELDAETCHEELLNALRDCGLPAPNPRAGTIEYPLPGRGPHISNIRAPDASFVGRREEIDLIHAMLHPAPAEERIGASATGDAVTSSKGSTLHSVVVHGLGGVGKTELVLKCAWEYGSEYDLVWWVQAGTPVSAVNDLIDLAKALNLPERANHDETVLSLWSALRQRDRWLLILDDADDPAVLRNTYWPHINRGHILVTSRTASGWERLTTRNVQLKPLTPEEAEEFLTRHIPEASTDRGTTRQVAQDLGYLPLTLAQAVTFIRESGSTVGVFHDLLREQFDKAVQASQRKTNEVAGGYSLILMLSAQNKAPATRDLLQLLSMFYSTNIPRKIVTRHYDVLPAQLRTAMADELTESKTVRELSRFSLIEAFTDRFNVHSVVQATVRSAMTPDEIRLWSGVAVRLLRRAFPRDPEEPSAWSACAFLMPHVQAVTRIVDRYGGLEERNAHLLLLAGIYLHGRCDWRQAQDYLERAWKIRTRLYGDDSLRAAECLFHLGRSQFPLAQLDEARKSVREALEIRQQRLEPSHPLIAGALIHLAEIMREFATENEEAIAYTEQAERILREVGANEAGVADTLLIRGTILRNAGRLREALEAQQASLEINEQVRASGPSSLEAAVNHSNIGVIQRDFGRWDVARREFETAIAIMEPLVGADHLEVAQAKKYLGDICRRTGDLPSAARLLNEVTDIHRNRPGEQHKLAACLAKLGSIQLELGEPDAATANLEQALGIYEVVYGPQHPYTAKAISRLAPAYIADGRTHLAGELLLRAQQIFEACYGPDYPALVWILRSLARVHELGNDMQTAQTLRARAELIERKAEIRAEV